MKYLSSQPFSSPAATQAFRDNYPMPEPAKSIEVVWVDCLNCGSPVRPHEKTCPACGYVRGKHAMPEDLRAEADFREQRAPFEADDDSDQT